MNFVRLFETSLKDALSLVIKVLIFIGFLPIDIENSSRFFSNAVPFSDSTSF
nr:MAG TPA: hypothetical protein [Bacteriophage sp.]